MEKTALLSDCGTFQYRLSRRWGLGPALLFIMLHPSTIDAKFDDATILKCMGFAKRYGFSAIEVVNIFAFRASSLRALKSSGWRTGPMNAHHVARATAETLRDGGKIVLAWGANICGRSEAVELINDLVRRDIPMHALRVLADGSPAHPRALSYNSEMQIFVPKRRTVEADQSALQVLAGKAAGLISSVRARIGAHQAH